MRFHHILNKMAKIKNKTKISQVLVRVNSNYNSHALHTGKVGQFLIR